MIHSFAQWGQNIYEDASKFSMPSYSSRRYFSLPYIKITYRVDQQFCPGGNRPKTTGTILLVHTVVTSLKRMYYLLAAHKVLMQEIILAQKIGL